MVVLSFAHAGTGGQILTSFDFFYTEPGFANPMY
jgi:hypothetical protein